MKESKESLEEEAFKREAATNKIEAQIENYEQKFKLEQEEQDKLIEKTAKDLAA